MGGSSWTRSMPGPGHCGEVVLGDLQGGLAGGQRAQVVAGALAADGPDHPEQAGAHDDEGEDRDRRPALRLALRRGRGHATVGRPAPRQQVLDAEHEAIERPARGGPRPARRGLDGRDAAGDVVGERDRASGPACRRAAPRAGPGRASAARASRPPPSPRSRSSRRCRRRRPSTKRWWRCSIADCGWSVTIASLSSSGPSWAMTFGETRTSESPTVISPRQTSGSRSVVGRPRSRCGSGSVDRRASRIR